LAEAKTVMIVAYDDEILGLIAVADELKNNAKDVIQAIENLGIITVMITGDNERTAKAIAAKAGISQVIASVLPEGKVDQIKSLQKTYGKVAMVGDDCGDVGLQQPGAEAIKQIVQAMPELRDENQHAGAICRIGERPVHQEGRAHRFPKGIA
jgi:high-affinity K+ transport system ATPase subunit B